MRLRTVLVVGALVVLCASSDALAQRRGFGGGRLGNNVFYMSLLRVEKIQEAIDLTDEQGEKIEAARDELAEERRAARGQGRGGFGGFQDMTDEEREEFLAQLQERNAEQAKAEKAKAAEILEEAQMKRLGEIFVQVAGADAVNDPDIAAALKIDDDLKEKLDTARQEAQQEMFAGFGDLQGLDREERNEKIAELRAEADKQVLAVVSAEQQEQLEGMKGEALELTADELNQARGRGGRGGRGRGGRGGQ